MKPRKRGRKKKADSPPPKSPDPDTSITASKIATVLESSDGSIATYLCKYCDTVVGSKTELIAHSRKHMIDCTECSFRSISRAEVTEHCQKEHNVDFETRSQQVVASSTTDDEMDKDPCSACVFCNFMTYSTVHMEKHTELRHPGMVTKSVARMVTKQVSAEIRQGDAVFYCSMSGKDFALVPKKLDVDNVSGSVEQPTSGSGNGTIVIDDDRKHADVKPKIDAGMHKEISSSSHLTAKLSTTTKEKMKTRVESSNKSHDGFTQELAKCMKMESPDVGLKPVTAKPEKKSPKHNASIKVETIYCLTCPYNNVRADNLRCHTISQHPVGASVASYNTSELDNGLEDFIFFCVKTECSFQAQDVKEYQKHLLMCCSSNKNLRVLDKERLKSTVGFIVELQKKYSLTLEDGFNVFVPSDSLQQSRDSDSGVASACSDSASSKSSSTPLSICTDVPNSDGVRSSPSTMLNQQHPFTDSSTPNLQNMATNNPYTMSNGPLLTAAGHPGSNMQQNMATNSPYTMSHGPLLTAAGHPGSNMQQNMATNSPYTMSIGPLLTAAGHTGSNTQQNMATNSPYTTLNGPLATASGHSVSNTQQSGFYSVNPQQNMLQAMQQNQLNYLQGNQPYNQTGNGLQPTLHGNVQLTPANKGSDQPLQTSNSISSNLPNFLDTSSSNLNLIHGKSSLVTGQNHTGNPTHLTEVSTPPLTIISTLQTSNREEQSVNLVPSMHQQTQQGRGQKRQFSSLSNSGNVEDINNTQTQVQLNSAFATQQNINAGPRLGVSPVQQNLPYRGRPAVHRGRGRPSLGAAGRGVDVVDDDVILTAWVEPPHSSAQQRDASPAQLRGATPSPQREAMRSPARGTMPSQYRGNSPLQGRGVSSLHSRMVSPLLARGISPSQNRVPYQAQPRGTVSNRISSSVSTMGRSPVESPPRIRGGAPRQLNNSSPSHQRLSGAQQSPAFTQSPKHQKRFQFDMSKHFEDLACAMNPTEEDDFEIVSVRPGKDGKMLGQPTVVDATKFSYCCLHCGKDQGSKNHMKKHMKTYHNEALLGAFTNTDTGQWLYFCPQLTCEFMTYDEQRLRDHLKKCCDPEKWKTFDFGVAMNNLKSMKISQMNVVTMSGSDGDPIDLDGQGIKDRFSTNLNDAFDNIVVNASGRHIARTPEKAQPPYNNNTITPRGAAIRQTGMHIPRGRGSIAQYRPRQQTMGLPPRFHNPRMRMYARSSQGQPPVQMHGRMLTPRAAVRGNHLQRPRMPHPSTNRVALPQTTQQDPILIDLDPDSPEDPNKKQDGGNSQTGFPTQTRSYQPSNRNNFLGNTTNPNVGNRTGMSNRSQFTNSPSSIDGVCIIEPQKEIHPNWDESQQTTATHEAMVTDSGDMPQTTDSGDIPQTTDSGDMPQTTYSGDIPQTTDSGDIPQITDFEELMRLSEDLVNTQQNQNNAGSISNIAEPLSVDTAETSNDKGLSTPQGMSTSMVGCRSPTSLAEHTLTHQTISSLTSEKIQNNSSPESFESDIPKTGNSHEPVEPLDIIKSLSSLCDSKASATVTIDASKSGSAQSSDLQSDGDSSAHSVNQNPSVSESLATPEVIPPTNVQPESSITSDQDVTGEYGLQSDMHAQSGNQSHSVSGSPQEQSPELHDKGETSCETGVSVVTSQSDAEFAMPGGVGISQSKQAGPLQTESDDQPVMKMSYNQQTSIVDHDTIAVHTEQQTEGNGRQLATHIPSGVTNQPQVEPVSQRSTAGSGYTENVRENFSSDVTEDEDELDQSSVNLLLEKCFAKVPHMPKNRRSMLVERFKQYAAFKGVKITPDSKVIDEFVSKISYKQRSTAVTKSNQSNPQQSDGKTDRLSQPNGQDKSLQPAGHNLSLNHDAPLQPAQPNESSPSNVQTTITTVAPSETDQGSNTVHQPQTTVPSEGTTSLTQHQITSPLVSSCGSTLDPPSFQEQASTMASSLIPPPPSGKHSFMPNISLQSDSIASTSHEMQQKSKGNSDGPGSGMEPVSTLTSSNPDSPSNGGSTCITSYPRTTHNGIASSFVSDSMVQVYPHCNDETDQESTMERDGSYDYGTNLPGKINESIINTDQERTSIDESTINTDQERISIDESTINTDQERTSIDESTINTDQERTSIDESIINTDQDKKSVNESCDGNTSGPSDKTEQTVVKENPITIDKLTGKLTLKVKKNALPRPKKEGFFIDDGEIPSTSTGDFLRRSNRERRPTRTREEREKRDSISDIDELSDVSSDRSWVDSDSDSDFAVTVSSLPKKAKKMKLAPDPTAFDIKIKGRFRCWMCSKIFLKCSTVKVHIVKKHAERGLCAVDLNGSEDLDKSQLVLFCPKKCRYATLSLSGLNNHVGDCIEETMVPLSVADNFLKTDFVELQKNGDKSFKKNLAKKSKRSEEEPANRKASVLIPHVAPSQNMVSLLTKNKPIPPNKSVDFDEVDSSFTSSENTTTEPYIQTTNSTCETSNSTYETSNSACKMSNPMPQPLISKTSMPLTSQTSSGAVAIEIDIDGQFDCAYPGPDITTSSVSSHRQNHPMMSAHMQNSNQQLRPQPLQNPTPPYSQLPQSQYHPSQVKYTSHNLPCHSPQVQQVSPQLRQQTSLNTPQQLHTSQHQPHQQQHIPQRPLQQQHIQRPQQHQHIPQNMCIPQKTQHQYNPQRPQQQQHILQRPQQHIPQRLQQQQHIQRPQQQHIQQRPQQHQYIQQRPQQQHIQRPQQQHIQRPQQQHIQQRPQQQHIQRPQQQQHIQQRPQQQQHIQQRPQQQQQEEPYTISDAGVICLD